MLSCQQRRRYLFFEDKEVRYLYLRLQAFPLEWHRFFWEQGFFGLGIIATLIFVASMCLEGFQRRCHRFFGDKVVQCFEDLRQKLFGTVSLGSRDSLVYGSSSHLYLLQQCFWRVFSERRHRFFGDKVVKCFEDLRQKLFGTVSSGSRDFLCLGVMHTSKLIFVAAMVLKGFQRKTAHRLFSFWVLSSVDGMTSDWLCMWREGALDPAINIVASLCAGVRFFGLA
jgi:hypothetical protein